MNVASRRAIAFVSVAVVTTGCSAPLSHVGTFSQASAEMASRAVDAYERVNAITVERRISDIASDPELLPSEETFQDLVSPEAMQLRIALLQGIASYSAALGSFAAADFRAGIDEAAKDLYGALGDLQATYALARPEEPPLPGTSEELALIATAVDAIGVTIAERRRRAALRTIVTQADPGVQRTLTVISADLSLFQDYILVSLGAIEADMLKAYREESASLSYDERVERLRRIWRFQRSKAAAAKLLPGLGDAATKIATGHSTMKEAVETRRFTTPQLVREIREIASLAESLKRYYDVLLEEE